MLFENDGSAGDVLNLYTELFGDGRVMDAMRPWLARQEEAKAGLIKRDIAATAARVHEAKERKVLEAAADMVPDFSVPLRLYHGYAAAFKKRADELGIEMEQNGYECWYDGDFQAYFRKRYPELCYTEEKRNARIVVNQDADSLARARALRTGLQSAGHKEAAA